MTEWKVKSCVGNGDLEDYLNRMGRDSWVVQQIIKTDAIRCDFTVILFREVYEDARS